MNPWRYYKDNCLEDIPEKLQVFWRIYGGVASLFKSVYLHLAFALTLAVYPMWMHAKLEWFEIVISVVPSLLGLSLAAYAMLLSFGDDNFRHAISGSVGDKLLSPFIRMNAMFLHFVMVQVCSLLFGIIGKAWSLYFWPVAFMGTLLFLYGILLGCASALAIWTTARIYDRMPR